MLDEYTKEDVLGLPHAKSGVVRDEAWHREYFQRIGDIVIDMLDKCDDIPSFLASELVPEEFIPKDLLPAAEIAY